MKGNKLTLKFIAFLAAALLFAAAGCAPDPEPVDEPDEDLAWENDLEEPVSPDEEVEPEETEPAADYFWPWLSHGQLLLSSTEIIDGPHLFESDTGFVGEFTRDREYKGRIVWLVDKTDVFEIEWITLTFDVEYYEQHEWQFDMNYIFEIDNLEPEAEDEGVQIFQADLVEEQQGFRVVIDRVILGKEQEGSFTADPIDYVAMEVEIMVVDKP